MLLVKRALFQLHWCVGITAGVLLMVIGFSGAVLSFREELLDLINPGARQVAPSAQPVLTPMQLLDVTARAHPGRAIGTLTLRAEAGAAAQVAFALPPGQRGRGESLYLDPYTGAALPALVGEHFFEWTERLHRWLLLPREPGRVAAGVLAICLLWLALSGLYLRWPRRPLDWRAWFGFDPALKGRAFLWNLHAVAGTCVLPLFLVATTTGLYWCFDAVRSTVDAWFTAPRDAQAPQRMRGVARADAGAVDLAPAWAAFGQRAGAWDMVILRVPAGAAPSVQFTWLGMDAAHERARNRMLVQLPAGQVTLDERHAAKADGDRFLAAIYPLHMGTYFGLPGRIAMTLSALALPLFGITGWMLYLDRRRKQRALAQERARHLPAPAAGAGEGWLVAFASQTGTAEALALRSAAALEAAGCTVTLLSMAQLDVEQLRHHQRALFVASSFGEGDPPDAARRFARQLAQARPLPQLHYGLLALGDRHYRRFCGFGQSLSHDLTAAGAQPLFPMVEVDDGDAAALALWWRQLAAVAGTSESAEPAVASAPFGAWRLASRTLLNPGSQGEPLYAIDLVPQGDAALAWTPGALAELRPQHAPATVAAYLAGAWDGTQVVQWQGQDCLLAQALAASALPAPGATDAQALADRLQPLQPRRYSVASAPHEETLRLLVRQARHEGGLGIASGWLTAHAPIGTTVELRLLPNPGFAAAPAAAPCIFIGNGSGYAGLRGHLVARVAAGATRNWLLLGERQRAHDAFSADELAGWQADGALARVDLVFSRDQAARVYVQDRLREQAHELRRWIAEGAVVYVCGSLAGMAAGVDAALAELLGQAALDDLVAEGRYRRDVY